MEEHAKREESAEESKQNIQKNAAGLLENIKKFLIELLDFRHDTDRVETLKAIQADVPFKGATAWILIFAVFVASIGLNADSTAVVIGAMLISPLMGPILGIGMSFALNDIDTFKKSAISLATMIVLSLFSSFLFFYLFPLSEDTSELLGRTKPDIRDVLIAFFGGLALMVARTKKGTIASVIFGVAIATALMPPLCTAGYGLAIWNIKYFLGAMYLFTINAIFIALATFIVLKLLNFPMHKYANAARRQRYKLIAAVVGIVVMAPAVYTFINVYKENKINTQMATFIKLEIKDNDYYQLIDKEYDIEKKILELNLLNEITDAEINSLENRMNTDPRYSALVGSTVVPKGKGAKSYELISTAYEDKREELRETKVIVKGLETEIEELKQTIINLNAQLEQDAINRNEKVVAFSRISQQTKIRYNQLERLDFANVLSTSGDFFRIDTIPLLTVKWNSAINDSILTVKEQELRSWMQQELELDTLFIKREIPLPVKKRDSIGGN
jgi:uncharacterized hydrophobic protein (TIGR00271 family)